MADNWKHKSTGMLCRTCMYYVAKAPQPTVDDPMAEYPSKIGRCRRHAPTMSGFPVMFETDWCGDHKLESVPPTDAQYDAIVERQREKKKPEISGKVKMTALTPADVGLLLETLPLNKVPTSKPHLKLVD